MLSAFMAFIEPGDEVIIFEPFFDQSVFTPTTCPEVVYTDVSVGQIYQQHRNAWRHDSIRPFTSSQRWRGQNILGFSMDD